MDNIEKRYEKKGTLDPCTLSKDDVLALTALITEDFSKPEVERYFRVSTNIDSTRVFSNSIQDFLNQEYLPEKIHDLSFWIEGWGENTRFDQAILLDFSRYSIQISVVGMDPVWVYDQYTKIVKFLKKKTAWYWPVITMERVIILGITVVLISNIIISLRTTFDKILLFGLWVFLVFYDTRKIWPYSNIRLKEGKSFFDKENVSVILVVLMIIITLVTGTILPLWRKYF